MDKDKAISFIRKNARLIDLAKYECLYENGFKDNFLNELRKYQNNDGGFGHGIEPDFLNPNSTPVATWFATEYVREVYHTKTNNDVIENLLGYLNSNDSFIDGMWVNTIESNNDYPHAIWWTYNNDTPSLNPTASLVAFIIDYTDESSDVYQKALLISKTCFLDYMKQENNKVDSHVTSCMIQMYESLSNNQIDNVFNLVDLREKLIDDVTNKIKDVKDKWETDYVVKPSTFIKSKQSFLYKYLKDDIKDELDFISKTQAKDGSFSVPWNWWTNFEQEEKVSLEYWKSIIGLNNLAFFNTFSKQ